MNQSPPSINGRDILWCPAAEIEAADAAAAEARHQAANQPAARAIRTQLVCAAINERQSREAAAQGRERMAGHHAAIAAACHAAAEALRIESGITRNL